MDDVAPPADTDRRASPADTDRRASAIAGLGAFARRPHPAGDVVARLGEAVEVADLQPFNHSCDPNLGWSGAGALVALREVAAGEELTLDYSTVLDDPSFVLYCHCGSTRCRQAVEGRDWQIPQLQVRYAGHWAPRIQARIDATG